MNPGSDVLHTRVLYVAYMQQKPTISFK